MRRACARRMRLAVSALLTAACAPSHPLSDAQLQGLAVRELFVAREHARQLLVWTDTDERGPTFEMLSEPDAPSDLHTLGVAATVPAHPIGADDLARLFRAHPDGWAAFFSVYPGAPGLIELARPVWSGDTLATVVVGRACGEHCFNAWRVTVLHGRVTATPPLRLPRS